VVHENIKIFRIASKLTQSDFAQRIGVSQETICNWERGRTKPDIGHVLTMVEMGANIDYLLFSNGSPLQRIAS